MNNWPRRTALIVIIALTAFSVAIVPGTAEVVDSDTDTVGVVVTWECPLLRTPPAGESLTISTGFGHLNLARLQVDAPPSGPGNCPTEEPNPDGGSTPSSEITPTATNGVGGFVSTVPVVAELPDTGTSPGGSVTAFTIIVMMTAGFVVFVASLIAIRRHQHQEV